MSIKDEIYSRCSVPVAVDGLMSFFDSQDCHFRWVIEAGCHSASDTLKLAAYPQFELFYLFEPDPVSYRNALKNLGSLDVSRYVIRQVALADKSAKFNLVSDGALGGEGSLITESNSSSVSEVVDAVALDDLIEREPVRDGLLWLDVEGFAHPALKGGLKTLDLVAAAKIEVEFADMNLYRKSNYMKVMKLMSKKGFILKKANLNPCFFGDFLFLHRSKLSFLQRAKGISLRYTVLFLHGFLYRIMRKPGY